MSKQEETVEVVLRLPKAVVDFLQDREGDVAEYLARDTVDSLVSQIECICIDEPDKEPGQIAQSYNLIPIFKERGLLPSYWKVDLR